MTSKNQVCRTAAMAAVFGLFVALAPSYAAIQVFQGTTSHGSTQTINFSPSQANGTTVVGDTNPPPQLFFNFTANNTLHPNGSGIDTVNGLGYTTLSVAPQLSTIGWTYMDFQADSLLKDISPSLNSLFKFTVNYVNSAGVAQTPYMITLNFPWENNNGDSQHYYMTATGGDVITSFSLAFSDPAHPANTIQDIHNWDIITASVPVPEPASLAIWGIGALGCAMAGYRRRKAAQ